MSKRTVTIDDKNQFIELTDLEADVIALLVSWGAEHIMQTDGKTKAAYRRIRQKLINMCLNV